MRHLKLKRGVFLVLLLLWAGVAALLYVQPISARDDISNTSSALGQVIATLESSQNGKKWLDQALVQKGFVHAGQLIGSFIQLGDVSHTDAVIARNFNPKTGKEEIEREVVIHIKRNQNLEDGVLDLAHELVHALSLPQWDPYDPKLTLGQYVFAVIEGDGGEVDAFFNECLTSQELSKALGWKLGRCEEYIKDGMLQRELIVKAFYQVGEDKEKVIELLGEEAVKFPQLSALPAKLYSSTGQTPYPNALIQEFKFLNQVACGNTLKRLSSIEDNPQIDSKQKHKETLNFLEKRCYNL